MHHYYAITYEMEPEYFWFSTLTQIESLMNTTDLMRCEIYITEGNLTSEKGLNFSVFTPLQGSEESGIIIENSIPALAINSYML